MDGWCSVEDLTRWAFAQAPVVMANEAHDGLARSIRTREVGIRMVRTAHQAGVRRLAMEALSWRPDGSPGPVRGIAPHEGGYLAQPEMRALIATALQLGWTLWAYDVVIGPDRDPAELLSQDFTNFREREQARHLCELVAAAPAEPLLVWCGNGHAIKDVVGDWIPMGHHFAALSGREQFVIDQTPSVKFGDDHQRFRPELQAGLADTLAAYGGTAAILRDQAPPRLNLHTGVDAFIVSTDNALT